MTVPVQAGLGLEAALALAGLMAQKLEMQDMVAVQARSELKVKGIYMYSIKRRDSCYSHAIRVCSAQSIRHWTWRASEAGVRRKRRSKLAWLLVLA